MGRLSFGSESVRDQPAEIPPASWAWRSAPPAPGTLPLSARLTSSASAPTPSARKRLLRLRRPRRQRLHRHLKRRPSQRRKLPVKEASAASSPTQPDAPDKKSLPFDPAGYIAKMSEQFSFQLKQSVKAAEEQRDQARQAYAPVRQREVLPAGRDARGNPMSGSAR